MRFGINDVLKTVIISLVWLVAITITAAIVLLMFGNPDEPDAILYSIGFIFIPFFITTMLTINKHLLKKNGLGWGSLGFVSLEKMQLRNLVWQVPLFWLLTILVELVFLILFFGESKNLPETQISSGIMELNPLIFVLVFLTYAIFTPILEEIIFRGGLLQALESKFNSTIATIGSTVIFTVVHGVPFIIPALLVMGLSFAYLYQKYRSIYAPIILHMFINGINVVAVNLMF